ncbi:MAG: hypothetical protein KDA92_16725 [Planctomycetales bacterium]|nr:hypothetical protein [Planctomycetales bacterium]MCA9200914.1 hypothetical protein [Planctomycetales bacterium]
MTNHIDLREFITTGQFFGLGPTSSRDDVIARLGQPDDTGIVTKRKPRGTIFVYGGIELHFNDADRLALIHFDYPSLPPTSSPSLSVSPWVLTDESPLADVLAACADCGIELQHVSDDPSRVYRAASGVSLSFYDPHDPDRTGLAAVSLGFSDGDR